MASYQAWIGWFDGRRNLELDIGLGARFEYVKAVNHAGHFTLELPYQLPRGNLQIDNVFQFWRGISDSSAKHLDFIGFIRYWRWERQEDGSIRTIIKGHDPNGLLARRIVAYDKDDTKTKGFRDPDNIMLDVFKENFLSDATNVFRDMTKIRGLPLPYSASISTKGIPTNLTNWNGYFAWMPVNDLFKELQEHSFQVDNTADKSLTMYYGIDVLGFQNTSSGGKPLYQFRINLGQWGRDNSRSEDRPSSIIFNHAHGNLINEFYEEDHRHEKNAIYSGGDGTGADKNVKLLVDINRAYASGFARCEGWVDARGEIDDDAITDKAYAALAAGRPTIIAGGDLVDTDYARYGRQWYHGDKVTIEVFGNKYDGVIFTTQLRLEGGEETITSRVIHEST